MIQLPEGFIQGGADAIGPDTAHIIHLFHGHRLIQRISGPLALERQDYGGLIDAHSHWEIIGHYENRLHLAVALPATQPLPSLPEGWQASGLRQWLGQLPDTHTAIALQGSQLLDWARTHRFCGACGTPTVRIGHERAVRCPRCSHTSYPRISPAMMVLITRGRQMLLAHNVQFPPGRYSALAGFLEAGETIEAAIHREVLEEVGLKVHRLRYFGSQSWAFPHSLMIAFTAEWLSGDIVPDGQEIADARWFDPAALPDLPDAGISISRALIDQTAIRLRQV
ncbi:MAG: NAD(+) diphosphatase [Lautropia sp.]|nr:NAD(+) diphosphatase [Lautropia sp.]